MTDELSRAISFANNYFALVDGLAYGLEDHLAEDVSLDWFGKIVKGKRNVAAFMRINMTNSRHVFHEIAPTSSIGPRRKRTSRRKSKLEGNSAKTGNETDALIKNELNFTKLCIKDSEIMIKEEKFEPNVDDNELKSLLTQEIPVDRLNDVTVKQEKDQDESLQKMDCELIGAPAINKNDTIKFVKANGVVQIHRSKRPNKIRKWESCAFVSGLPGHTCRRQCRLQVAYTLQNDERIKCEADPEKSKNVDEKTDLAIDRDDCRMKINICDLKATRGKKRLNSCEEENEMIMELEPSFNPFEDFDSFDDRRRFLECFEAEMSDMGPKFHFTTPKYVGDRLVFDWGRKQEKSSDDHLGGFKFNYSIHSIVYESNRRCQTSLSEEFEERKSLSDTEKSV